jgi:hypothetical protein
VVRNRRGGAKPEAAAAEPAADATH